MRIAVLWTHLSGYLNACLRALAQANGPELLVSDCRPDEEAPFAGSQFAWIPQTYIYDARPDAAALLARLEAFSPDLMLVSSWHISAYRRACQRFRGRALRVCCMDNQWKGTAKQWGGVLIAPWFVLPMFDAVFVPGERQAIFARKLGFSDERIWRGVLSCDHAAFSAVHDRRRTACDPKAFLFAGRLAPEKQIALLLAAYQMYRSDTRDPWPLIVAGAGPLTGMVEQAPGIAYRGFVQPGDMPLLFAEASCLVLPSSFEPWGLVIHEASAAGLPVICTSACGAAPDLVQDGHNGYVVEPGNAEALARALTRFTSLTDERRRQMGDGGHALSLQFTPERWAECVLERGAEMMRTTRRALAQAQL